MESDKRKKKRPIHVHKEIIIDKDVTCCGECPFYYQEQEMNAILSCCEKRMIVKSSYDQVIPEICWRNKFEKIADSCPLLKEEGE